MNDYPCPICGKYRLECMCPENESKEDHENRQLVYELTGIRDESLHVKPYADMIDKLTYVQKADFAKRALDLERENISLREIKNAQDIALEEAADRIFDYRRSIVSEQIRSAKLEQILIDNGIPIPL